MAVTAEMIQQVRYEVQDCDLALPLLDDDVYTYILTKNLESVSRSALDAARMILMQLSLRGDHTVDIFSVKGSKVASEYRAALELYLKSPQLNPVYNNVGGYAGNISVSDMQSNINDLDNNIVQSPINPSTVTTTLSTDYFSV
jgi:hypothetical protein